MLVSYVYTLGLGLFLHLAWTILHFCLFFSGLVLLLCLYPMFHNAWHICKYSIHIWKNNEFVFPSPSKMPIHVKPELEVGDDDASKLGTNTEPLASAILRKLCECWRWDEKGTGRYFTAVPFYRTPGRTLVAVLHPTQLYYTWPGFFTNPDSFLTSDSVFLIHVY